MIATAATTVLFAHCIAIRLVEGAEVYHWDSEQQVSAINIAKKINSAQMVQPKYKLNLNSVRIHLINV